MMKKFFITLSLGFLCFKSFSQNINKIINTAEVERIERILSADDMQGRKTFTPGIDKAADFISSEFAKSKLQFFGNSKSYFQEITMYKVKTTDVAGTLDQLPLTSENTIINSTVPEINISNIKDYEVKTISKEDNFNKIAYGYLQSNKNLLVLVDTVYSNAFKRLKWYTSRDKFETPLSQIFILTSNIKPSTLHLSVTNEITQQHLKNVVGVLPGKSKRDEYVVYGGHYDHLGIGKPDKNMDSIYNGANDDAAGTTAVIMLANYFSKLNNNERTLVFVAFTAEEIGGFGSRYFSQQLPPERVMAMFNIEMIGTESKWGANSAYITGFEKSDMGKILQANLAGSKFHFEPDPYPKQNLFYRSDNATLAALGVPAHTISTSKMEQPPNNEPNYHKQSDEISTLDMNNMAEIIKAIALSSKTIISGKDTPTRILQEIK